MNRRETCYQYNFLHSLWEAVIAEVAVGQKRSSCLILLQSMDWVRDGRFEIDRGHKTKKAILRQASVSWTRVGITFGTFVECAVRR